MRRRDFLISAVATGATLALPEGALAASVGANGQTVSPAASLNPYPLGPDSHYQPGTPKGQVYSFTPQECSHFPGAQRKIDVYVPHQYGADKPACVLICLDGLTPTTPIVLDNLIQRREMPITIAIGLHWGSTPSRRGSENPRYNRSFEFDSTTERLADCILQDLLPQIQKEKILGPLPILLSDNPNDCGITGASTGGIGSFTVAWHRPDAFRRVYTKIGTFVGMRGGDRYPVLIRKTEPKPLRIFLQDGDKDGWPGGPEFGDWWMGNQEMERALSFAGYQVNHMWGSDGHDGRQGESILPDVMRWLWKDWPKPVESGSIGNMRMQSILKPGEPWQSAGAHASPPGPTFSLPAGRGNGAMALASNPAGDVYVQNAADGRIYRLDSQGVAKAFVTVMPGNNGMAFGPDERLYVAETKSARLLAFDAKGASQVIAANVRGCRLTVAHNGNVYMTEARSAITEARSDTAYSGKVWLIRPDGSIAIIADGLRGPTGVSVTPDGLWLCVAEGNGHHAWSYQVQENGTVQYGEPFYWLHVPDAAEDSGATEVCMDRQGWSYIATRLGVQVCDRNGRVTAILPVANDNLYGICFGGPHRETLYVTNGDQVFRRNVKTVGFAPWDAPIVLPAADAA